jgi:parallel beta-helix repeat protein
VGKAGLHLRAYGDGPVTVDGNCTEFTVIEVNANAVMIDGLRVRGATYYGVDFENVVGGTITRSILRDTCHAVYGVNLYSTDGGMTVSGNVAVGFSDAGIYLGFITSTGAEHIQVANNVSLGNNRGIIIEDIASATNVEVTGNTTRTNRATGVNPTNAGIFLHNVDGVLVDRNTVRRNDESGIELDINSSGNVVSNNVVSGHTFDLANFGSSNCFSGNTYTTSTGSLPACR